jgi:uncharacterized protein (DUF2225 family)
MLTHLTPLGFPRRRWMQMVGSLAACACVARPALAHTYTKEMISCPVDGTKFQISVTMSYTTFGTFSDFQKRGAIGSLYEDMVVSCPSCRYAGYPDDFTKGLTGRALTWVLGDYQTKWGNKKLTEAEECEAAADRYIFEQAENEAVANLYLVASYLLRGARGPLDEKRKDYQRLAAKFFLQALAAGEIEATHVGPATYLVAELERRTGDFGAAIDHYDSSLKYPDNPAWLKDVVKDQRALAVKRDPTNDL